jgi:chorismate dehydratase
MLRIGAPEYINALPYFYPFLTKKVPLAATFIFDTPSQINQFLLNDEIDIGLISAACYLKNQDLLSPLTSYGIGAVDEVMSVALFTKKNINDLNGVAIGVTRASASSTNLLKVLARKFWKIEAEFVEFDSNPEQFDAFLLIGDKCLTYPRDAYNCIDLAKEWFNYTQKPFIFALFATKQKSKVTEEFEQKLEMAYTWSSSNRDEIIQAAKNKTLLAEALLQKYFKCLSYKFTKEHFEALALFEKSLIN